MPGGHQAADLGLGGGGHDGHAQVDGPAHLLGVGQHRLKPWGKSFVTCSMSCPTSAPASFSSMQADVLGRHLQAPEARQEHADVAQACRSSAAIV